VPFCGLEGKPWEEVLELTARNVADIADIGKKTWVRFQLEAYSMVTHPFDLAEPGVDKCSWTG